MTLPGTAATDKDIEDFAAKLRHGVVLSLGDAAALKRLIFEAQTLTIAELRSSIQPGEEAQKKLPAAERSLRIENQRKRLVGLPLLKGGWQVAYALYDRFAHMMETDELRFIAPNECITRDAELAGGKPPKAVVLDASKTGLTLKDGEALSHMALTSDHELYQAMIRRALAMDVVGLATFSSSRHSIMRRHLASLRFPGLNFCVLIARPLWSWPGHATASCARLRLGSFHLTTPSRSCTLCLKS